MTTSDDQEGQRTRYSPSELERLGRERPDVFSSVWVEAGFCFALLGSMFVSEYFVSGFNVLLPALSKDLNIPAAAETWPASVFSLVLGALLLPFGRLADMYGGYIVFVTGLVWLIVWSLVAGFSQNYIMMIVCRALQGLGPAAFLPAGTMILGVIYRPGPRKNLIFGLYGAFAPFGFFAGIFFAGLSVQTLNWAWFFFFGTIMLAIVTVASCFCVPRDHKDKKHREVEMDWWGSATVVAGLVLVVFAITDGSHAPNGWATPYIPITFVIGILFLLATVYIEGWVAEYPILPADVFQIKGMSALIVATFFQYGVFGMFLFYSSFYIQEVLGASPLLTTAWFTPMCIGGLILATVGGFILHLIPGRIILIISGVSYVVSVLLFAILPKHFNYWAYIFPAMVTATLGVDVTYNVTNVFITTAMPKRRQGLAGALSYSIVFLGISFFLGFADLAVSQTADRGQRESYKVAFWMAFGIACSGLVVMVLGVNIGKASSDLTADEKAELAKELANRLSQQ